MAKTLDTKKTAISLGLVFAFWQLCSALLIVAGGSTFVNWVSSLQFIATPLAVAPFNLVSLIIGVIVAFVEGAVLGAIFAYLYEML